VLDYAGDANEIGKNVGDDLREGKPTLPLIYLMENGTPSSASWCAAASSRATSSISTPSWPPSPASGALDYTRREAETAAKRAAEAIADLPDSIYKSRIRRELNRSDRYG
jgi:octaprenyl-diphosphate synthase